jgi:hypothetical protein
MFPVHGWITLVYPQNCFIIISFPLKKRGRENYCYKKAEAIPATVQPGSEKKIACRNRIKNYSTGKLLLFDAFTEAAEAVFFLRRPHQI